MQAILKENMASYNYILGKVNKCRFGKKKIAVFFNSQKKIEKKMATKMTMHHSIR